MIKMIGVKNNKTVTVVCDENLQITVIGKYKELFEYELEKLLTLPNGGTYCPEEKTALHIYLTLKEHFFDEVLKEEIDNIGEMENEKDVIY